MGLMQRTKGKVYERKIASLLRDRFPGCTVRRASQADRAANSDVFVTGHPVLERLWLELTDARAPDPRAKLAQAERDVARGVGGDRWPVVIWHVTGERRSQATMRLKHLAATCTEGASLCCCDVIVTLDLDDFLNLLG